ncbi:hypothetical protein GCM10027049_02200 [Mucilaginibacter puniceus]
MTISSTSQLIREILDHELQSYKDFGFDITHRPDIGDQYENALVKGLKGAFPSDIDLRIVSGNIYNSVKKESGKYRTSGQIDCMLVYGEGHYIPGTNNKYAYPVDQVLAIIEVKKNFYTAELTDSYDHLKGIREIYNDLTGLDAPDWQHFRRMFAQLTGKALQNYEDHENLSLQNEAIFHGWLTQYNSPLRIVFGYEGFKNEASFREKFYNFLSTKTLQQGYGPYSIPDLMVCGESCIVKLNGEPYPSFFKNGKLEFLATNTGHTIAILCELLLSRISRITPIDFSEDKDAEPLNYFMSMQYVSQGALNGWAYEMHELDESALNQQNELQPWQPLEVSEQLFKCFKVLLTNNIPISFFENKEALLQELLATHFTAVLGTELTLTTRELRVAEYAGGRRFVGENGDGYFDLWEVAFIQTPES